MAEMRNKKSIIIRHQ